MVKNSTRISKKLIRASLQLLKSRKSQLLSPKPFEPKSRHPAEVGAITGLDTERLFNVKELKQSDSI